MGPIMTKLQQTLDMMGIPYTEEEHGYIKWHDGDAWANTSFLWGHGRTVSVQLYTSPLGAVLASVISSEIMSLENTISGLRDDNQALRDRIEELEEELDSLGR